MDICKELKNNDNYRTTIAKNGSLNGNQSGLNYDRLSGSWAWIDGKFCREFEYGGKNFPERCANVLATSTAVKIVEKDNSAKIWAIN